jgi:tetratricopeptide (TPR) repeat protein
MLEQRISDHPVDPIALTRLAAIYQREGNVEKAISAYEAILQIVPNNLGTINKLTELYASKNLPKAYELAKTAYKLAPNNVEVAHTLGRLAYQSGDRKLAANLLQQTVLSQPDNPVLLFDYSQAAYSLGNIPEAQTALRGALRLNLAAPQSLEAQRLLDMIGFAATPATAVAANAHVMEILKTEPDYVPALFVQAVVNTQNGDAAAAEKNCEKILTQYPDFAPAQKQLAMLYAADPSKLNQAYDWAVKARETLPADPVLSKTFGIILVQRGDFTRAVNVFNEAAPRLNSDPELFFYLGKAQFQLKSRVDSKASLQKALTLNLNGPLADAAKQMIAQMK